MSSGDNHTFSQRVIDVDSTVYESVVIINEESVYDVQGLYQCSVVCQDDIGAEVDSASDSTNVTGDWIRSICVS